MYANTCTHVHACVPPWIFDNPNWIPQLGARRWFSTILALHRPRLSCKIVSPHPRPKSCEFPIPSVLNSWETIGAPTSHTALFLIRFYGNSRSSIGLERGKMRIVTPPLKISKLWAENKRRMVVCFNGYFDAVILPAWRVQSNEMMFNNKREFYCWTKNIV